MQQHYSIDVMMYCFNNSPLSLHSKICGSDYSGGGEFPPEPCFVNEMISKASCPIKYSVQLVISTS